MTDTKKSAEALRRVLADTYNLYVLTHGYHWNVEGPNFKPLHELFEENYTALWKSLDDIAERIRALGVYAPMGTSQLSEGSKIDTSDNSVPSSNAMVQKLIAGHETWIRGAKGAMEVARDEDDPATEGLLAELVTAHEKMAWMLRASLER